MRQVETLASSPRMLVGAEWVDAISGATLTTEVPATGRSIAPVPAVRRARRAEETIRVEPRTQEAAS